MVTINFTNKAVADIDAIAHYLQEYSSKYSARFVKEVFKRVGMLRTFPEMGRILPEIDEKEVRELIYHRYRIVYHIVALDRIDIITVQHSSRNLKQHLPNNDN